MWNVANVEEIKDEEGARECDTHTVRWKKALAARVPIQVLDTWRSAQRVE